MLMKKYVQYLMTTALITVALSASSFAAGGKNNVHDMFENGTYGTAGCGLGSVIFGDKPGMIQLVAVTTNNYFFPQSFAITSGTSNCDIDPDKAGNKTASLFIMANRDALQKEISRGQGEALNNLAGMVGCTNTQTFGKALQKNYQTIFPTATVDSEQVLKQIQTTIENDAQLSTQCQTNA